MVILINNLKKFLKLILHKFIFSPSCFLLNFLVRSIETGCIKILIIFSLLFSYLTLSGGELNVRPALLIPPLNKIEVGKKITLIPADKSGKSMKIPTSWGGGELLQEEKVHMGFPVTTYSLTGGAYIVHRNIKLNATKIEIIGSDALFGTLTGNVKIEEVDKKITLTSNKALYDKMEETIILEGRPSLFYLNSNKSKTKLTAKKITRFMKESKIVLDGGVIIEDDNFIILSQSATYDEKSNFMEMDNSPLLFGKDRYLTAEKLGYDYEKQITSLTENTIVVIRSTSEADDTPDTDKKKDTQLTFFTGNELSLSTSTQNREQEIVLSGNARIVREDYEFNGEKLKSFGEEYKNLESREYFTFLDKKAKMKVSGELFEHDEKSGYTHITKQPKVEFQNEKGETTSTLTTIEIERFTEKKEIVARGNVNIESENGTVRGQFATYYETEKKLVVEGNPSLERDEKKIFCGLIYIYPEENKIIMSDGIGIIKEK